MDIYTDWQREGSSSETVSRPGEALYSALTEELGKNRDQFELRPSLRAAGIRLVDELEHLQRAGLVEYDFSQATDPDGRALVFVSTFVDRIAGNGGLVSDAVIRRTAVRCADKLLSSAAVRQAVETGLSGGLPISRGLFCDIYTLFFSDAVEQFLTTVIAEKVKILLTVHVPVISLLDPEGKIADWIAKKVFNLIPSPCERDSGADGSPSLADLGRELVDETVNRALGLAVPAGGIS